MTRRPSDRSLAYLAPWALAMLVAACGGRPTPRGVAPASPPASASEQPPAPPPSPARARFVAAAEAMGLVYADPDGFAETPVTDNIDVTYDYAVASADRGVEMRFALRPYAGMPEGVRKLGVQFSWPFFETAIANLTRGERLGRSAPPMVLDARAFAADKARMVTTVLAEAEPDSFGRGYALCSAAFLHRAELGDAYVFVLAVDVAAFEANMDEAKWHALRFTPR